MLKITFGSPVSSTSSAAVSKSSLLTVPMETSSTLSKPRKKKSDAQELNYRNVAVLSGIFFAVAAAALCVLSITRYKEANAEQKRLLRLEAGYAPAEKGKKPRSVCITFAACSLFSTFMVRTACSLLEENSVSSAERIWTQQRRKWRRRESRR